MGFAPNKNELMKDTTFFITTMRLLIAFGGKMGSGKDTASEYLCNKYNGVTHSFAAPIYNIMKYSQGVCNFKEKKDRAFLQFVGTDWARAQDPEVWINIALKNTPKDGNVFLSDIRFMNELTALKKSGWICVRLHRSSQSQRVGTGAVHHTSEKEIDTISEHEWDYVVQNNGDINHFYNKLDKMIASIKCR
jgi:hypothetical protein